CGAGGKGRPAGGQPHTEYGPAGGGAPAAVQWVWWTIMSLTLPRPHARRSHTDTDQNSPSQVRCVEPFYPVAMSPGQRAARARVGGQKRGERRCWCWIEGKSRHCWIWPC